MKHFIKLRWKRVFQTMDTFRRIITGVIFWLVFLGVILALFSGKNVRTAKGSILHIQPIGNLVDAYTMSATYGGFPLGNTFEETLLKNITTALNEAVNDKKIIGVWVELSDLAHTSPALAGELADALKQFRRSGKSIIASADSYDTARYRIASEADSIFVDRLGMVFPTGYAYWRAYFAEGIEKIGGEVRLFRSGESKSAMENFIRNSMSKQERQNEERLLGDLWSEWLENVAANRGLTPDALEAWIKNYDRHLMATGGNGAQAALDALLVDGIEEGGVVQGRLNAIFGMDAPTVHVEDYILEYERRKNRKHIIAVIPVVGTLAYGTNGNNIAGSDNVISAIMSARNTPGVEGIVLRINSPGGDVRAGEAIRRVLHETRTQWNLPVVVSMGNVAASGGYWIALESDYIFTRPETVTGSIGVFMLSVSFQRGLQEWLGVRIDGFGTTRWAGLGHPGLPHDSGMANIYNAGVQDIDRMFQTLVSEKRGLDSETVRTLSGGIPWSGIQAVELGLADKIGGLDDAITYTAGLVNMDTWQAVYFESPLSFWEIIIRQIGKMSFK